MDKNNRSAVFGPVASRRLGLSLGIDLLDFKTCSLNCVYCELGLTNNLTSQRGRFRDYQQVLEQVQKRLLELDPLPDSLTLAGSGEPTLHLDLGKTLDGLKAISNIRRVVLTNSTLVHLPEVRQDLSKADIVVPSLDAISPEVFAQINCPAPGLEPRLMVEGLIRLRQIMQGQMWLEILLVRGINDQESELDKLRQAALAIQPDLIQLNTIVRPPACSGYEPVPIERLEAIAAGFGLPAQVASGSQAASSNDKAKLQEVIAHTTRMRPCTVEDLVQITGMSSQAVMNMLQEMRNNNLISCLEFDGRRYFQGAS